MDPNADQGEELFAEFAVRVTCSPMLFRGLIFSR